MRDIVKALRLLDEVEGSKGGLYERLGEVLIGQEPARTTFVRLGLDQVSRRNVIAYQTRIVVRNAAVFHGLRMDCKAFETLLQVATDLRQAPAPATVDQAVTVALAVETRTWELFEHELFMILQEHFGPFVASLRKGCERHLALLGSLQRKAGATDSDTRPAAGPVPLTAWRAADASRRATEPIQEDTAVWLEPLPPLTAHELLASMNPELFMRFLDGLGESVYLLDAARRVAYQNPAAMCSSGEAPLATFEAACPEGSACPTDPVGHLTCQKPCAAKRTLRIEADQNGDFWRIGSGDRREPVSVYLHTLSSGPREVVGSLFVVATRLMAGGAEERIDKLEQLAYLDALTGLANRRYLEVTMLSRLNELQRYSRAFAVLFADVDSLKAVNDSFGHLEGDRVLRAVADTLAGNSRTSDLFGRWGGDEFLGILANVDDQQILATVGKLRGCLSSCKCLIAGKELTVSVSIGATLAVPEDTLETLIARADRLMFQAKTSSHRGGGLASPAWV